MASLEVGIVGLPNVGKTTLFNALTESGAAVTSFAAVKTSANVGVASVPDERIALLAAAVSAREQVPATVGFADVSGLVRGAGASDGLGGEYLGHLRTTDALTQEKVIASLSKKCQDIFERLYYKNQSMQEIADGLGFSSENSAKTQKYKCMEQAIKQASAINLQSN